MRFLSIVLVGLVLELGAFTLVNRDALAVTTHWPVWKTGRDAFQARADRLLQKPTLPRRLLEQIASDAQSMKLPAVEARALAVASRKDPTDRDTQLREADARRRAGDLKQAERLYRAILEAPVGEKR